MMQAIARDNNPWRISKLWLIGVGLLSLGMASCQSPHQPTARPEPALNPGWPKPHEQFLQVSYQEVRATIPAVPGADYVQDDELCGSCHSAYATSFAANNVHRGDGCESCHGPGSKHMEAKGKEPGLIFSFKTMNPAVRAEACLKCHEQDRCSAGTQWRTSKHAHCGVSCTDCHRGHYDVRPGTPAVTEGNAMRLEPRGQGIVASDFQTTAYQDAGATPPATKKSNLPSLKGTSHNLGAVAPYTCYRCHSDTRALQEVAGPHQICGPNNFNCTTCHNVHGQIREESRRDLCLQCHNGAPTMAWHSSTHDLNRVACADCHNPHPSRCVPKFVGISHTAITRPKRLPMSVNEPEACYKCHQKIFGLNSLPSHHPVKEGKMVCSDCHDAHGQMEHNLKSETVNLLCWKCHADKQGPYVYEHPPVTENCAICHEPHGTVANNLLRQPVTFLCLRCHSGHRGSHGTNGVRTGIDTRPYLQPAFYTDCTQCHTMIHGSDSRLSGITNDFNRF
jgi:DmsE family decaheme c-type cytochrome